jgi:hypothetical protein
MKTAGNTLNETVPAPRSPYEPFRHNDPSGPIAPGVWLMGGLKETERS